jgi:putative pyoverdin transport system ATP-binding/permease protein
VKRLLKIVLSVIGKGGIARYIVLGLLSGMSSFLFINNVTRVIGLIISGKFTAVSREYIILFLSIILLFVWARRKLALLSISVTQKIGWMLRKQILSLALNANYQQLASRKPKIQSAILSDVGALTNASMGSIDFFIQLIMATSCLGLPRAWHIWHLFPWYCFH